MQLRPEVDAFIRDYFLVIEHEPCKSINQRDDVAQVFVGHRPALHQSASRQQVSEPYHVFQEVYIHMVLVQVLELRLGQCHLAGLSLLLRLHGDEWPVLIAFVLHEPQALECVTLPFLALALNVLFLVQSALRVEEVLGQLQQQLMQVVLLGERVLFPEQGKHWREQQD